MAAKLCCHWLKYLQNYKMSNLPCKLVRWKARRKKNGLDLSLFFNLGYKWKLSWSSVSMFGLFCFPIGCVISVHFLFIEGKEIIWSHKSWSWQIYWGGKGWTKRNWRQKIVARYFPIKPVLISALLNSGA